MLLFNYILWSVSGLLVLQSSLWSHHFYPALNPPHFNDINYLRVRPLDSRWFADESREIRCTICSVNSRIEQESIRVYFCKKYYWKNFKMKSETIENECSYQCHIKMVTFCPIWRCTTVERPLNCGWASFFFGKSAIAVKSEREREGGKILARNPVTGAPELSLP